jgi:hypothetical protein
MRVELVLSGCSLGGIGGVGWRIVVVGTANIHYYSQRRFMFMIASIRLLSSAMDDRSELGI